jgi:DNA polymerase elongation subunit (family B)
MKNGIKDILFIDIETVSAAPAFQDLEERMQHLWLKKAGTIRNPEEKSAEELYQDKSAIFAEFGQVVCIGMGFIHENEGQHTLRLSAIAGGDEKQLLLDFANLLEAKYPKGLPILCAHNGFEFDFPYLCRRMTIHGIPLPAALDILIHAKPWTNPHLDTLEMWKFGDRKNFTSLDLLAAIFNVPSSKSDIDGSKVSHVYHQEKDLARIAEYCMRDVDVLCRVYLHLKHVDIEITEVIVKEFTRES